MMQEAFPARFKSCHMIRQPWYLSIVYKLAKPFLKQKFKDRVSFFLMICMFIIIITFSFFRSKCMVIIWRHYIVIYHRVSYQLILEDLYHHSHLHLFYNSFISETNSYCIFLIFPNCVNFLRKVILKSSVPRARWPSGLSRIASYRRRIYIYSVEKA